MGPEYFKGAKPAFSKSAFDRPNCERLHRPLSPPTSDCGSAPALVQRIVAGTDRQLGVRIGILLSSESAKADSGRRRPSAPLPLRDPQATSHCGPSRAAQSEWCVMAPLPVGQHEIHPSLPPPPGLDHHHVDRCAGFFCHFLQYVLLQAIASESARGAGSCSAATPHGYVLSNPKARLRSALRRNAEGRRLPTRTDPAIVSLPARA